MIEKAVRGEPYECYVTEDTGVAGIMYFKDAVRCIEMIYQAPMEQIKTVNYSVTGLRDRLTARELELSIKKHIPGFSVVYKPDPKVMAIFKGRTLVEVSPYSAIAPPYTSLRCCSTTVPLLRHCSVTLYAPVKQSNERVVSDTLSISFLRLANSMFLALCSTFFLKHTDSATSNGLLHVEQNHNR